MGRRPWKRKMVLLIQNSYGLPRERSPKMHLIPAFPVYKDSRIIRSHEYTAPKASTRCCEMLLTLRSTSPHWFVQNKNPSCKEYVYLIYREINIFGFLPRDPPDRTSLSSLSMEGEGTLDLGLPGMEHSEPASKESSWFSISSSLTHLWQTLCWQGRISGWVKSSLQIGQISSLSMFLIGTWWWRDEDYWSLTYTDTY